MNTQPITFDEALMALCTRLRTTHHTKHHHNVLEKNSLGTRPFIQDKCSHFIHFCIIIHLICISLAYPRSISTTAVQSKILKVPYHQEVLTYNKNCKSTHSLNIPHIRYTIFYTIRKGISSI